MMIGNRVLCSIATGLLALTLSGGDDLAESRSASGATPLLGEIMWVGFSFAPRGWALCDGQLLPIDKNQSLYSLLGTTYGGDGRTTFALPDLRGRIPMHAGSGPGLTPRNLGSKSGAETTTLTTGEIPEHTHMLHYSPTNTAGTPQSILLSDKAFTAEAPEGTVDVVDHAGAGQDHENMPPYQCVYAVIALEGTYPSRN